MVINGIVLSLALPGSYVLYFSSALLRSKVDLPNFRSLANPKAITYTFIQIPMLSTFIQLLLRIFRKKSFLMPSKIWCRQTPLFQPLIIDLVSNLTYQNIPRQILYKLLAQHFPQRFLVRASFQFLSLQQHFMTISVTNHSHITSI